MPEADNNARDLEKIQAIKRPEGSVELCLAGDLVAEHEDLIRQLAEAQRHASGSLAGNPRARQIAGQIAALEELMREHVVTFHMRALPRLAWRDLVAAHPPRKGDDGMPLPADAQGVNVDTFVAAMLRACVFKPQLTEDSWATLDKELSDGQYEQLTAEGWSINRQKVSVPFSRAASRILQDSAPA